MLERVALNGGFGRSVIDFDLVNILNYRVHLGHQRKTTDDTKNSAIFENVYSCDDPGALSPGCRDDFALKSHASVFQKYFLLCKIKRLRIE